MKILLQHINCFKNVIMLRVDLKVNITIWLEMIL